MAGPNQVFHRKPLHVFVRVAQDHCLQKHNRDIGSQFLKHEYSEL